MLFNVFLFCIVLFLLKAKSQKKEFFKINLLNPYFVVVVDDDDNHDDNDDFEVTTLSTL